MYARMGCQVPFVFGDPFELLKPVERKVSQAMGCYWSNFAWNSNPNNSTGRASLYSQNLCAKLPSWEVGECMLYILTMYIMCMHVCVDGCLLLSRGSICRKLWLCIEYTVCIALCILLLQEASLSNFQRMVFNTTGEDVRIDMVSANTLTHERCNFWQRTEASNTGS